MPDTIDWNAAWQAAQKAGNMPRRDASFWNKRAPAFAGHAHHKSDYPQQFVDILKPQPNWRVLDVGVRSGHHRNSAGGQGCVPDRP